MFGAKKHNQYIGLLYVLPWIIGFTVFQLYPLTSTLFYSFTDYNMVNAPRFVGFDQYIRIFTSDRDFVQALKVTSLYVLIAVPAKLAFALWVAVLLSKKMRGMSIFRTVYYLPSILGGSVAVAVLWRFLFARDGVINSLLQPIGIAPIHWLGNPDIALYTISLLTVWQFGSSMVLFLAGIMQVPKDYYEAAAIDGASKTRMFFTITIPYLTPIILFNLIMQLVNAFQEFTGAFVITGGGPLKSTYLYAIKIYEEAFTYFKIGYASALSWILFLIIMTVTFVIFKTSDRWVHYEDGGTAK